MTQCLLVETFTFKGQCPITTCKFNTNKLETGCIGLERRDTYGKKLLTDRELRFYKFDSDVSIVTVAAHRKRVLYNVKRIITLYYYVHYIQNSCKLLQIALTDGEAKLLTRFPMRLKKMHITETLLANMLLESNFALFKKSLKLDVGIRQADIMFISDKRWLALGKNTEQ
jgi:hypothetical protein